MQITIFDSQDSFVAERIMLQARAPLLDESLTSGRVEDVKPYYDLYFRYIVGDNLSGLNRDELVAVRDLACIYHISNCEQLASYHLGEMKNKPDSTLPEDIGSIREDEKYADVYLTCDDGTAIPCSRFILSLRSDYFKGLFESGMEDSEEGIIRVPDVSGKTLRKLVEYLYTDNIQDMEDSAIELFGIAQRFTLLHMSSLVEEEIRDKVTTREDAQVAYDVAELFDCKSLRKFAEERMEQL